MSSGLELSKAEAGLKCAGCGLPCGEVVPVTVSAGVMVAHPVTPRGPCPSCGSDRFAVYFRLL